MKLTAKGMRRHRRLAVFLLAILAAFATPSTDAVTMVLVWLPLCALYELAAWALSRWEPQENKAD